MLNVKDQVYEAIKDIVENVSDSHPKERAKMPAIQYTEEDNSVHEYVGSKETQCHLLYRIDIWGENSTSEIAVQVDDRISKLGLRRIASGDVNDIELKHKVMRYEGILDIDTDVVHSK